MTLPALVLAAGLGTRLDPLTRLIAKPAVPLGDRALVERVIGWLASYDVRRVVVNLHHRPETIARVLGDGMHLGVNLRYSWEQPLLLGSAGGPRHALSLLDAETFLIVNGDTLCDVDLDAMVAAHFERGADVTLAVVQNTKPAHYNGLLSNDAHEVTGFVPRGRAHGSWHFVGVQVAKASVFAMLQDGVAADSIHGVYQDLLRTRPGGLRIWPTDGRFTDVGTSRDYLAAALEFPTASSSASAGLTRSIVWPGCTIGSNVALDEVLVVGGVAIPNGFEARRAILGPPTLVRPGDQANTRNGVAVFEL